MLWLTLSYCYVLSLNIDLEMLEIYFEERLKQIIALSIIPRV